MTTEQALQILDNASSLASGTRKDHEAVKEAVGILAALIESVKVKPADAKAEIIP